MRVVKMHMSVEEQAEMEYANAQAAKTQAVQDYNIMMGTIEDPSEEPDDEEEEEE